VSRIARERERETTKREMGLILKRGKMGECENCYKETKLR